MHGFQQRRHIIKQTNAEIIETFDAGFETVVQT